MASTLQGTPTNAAGTVVVLDGSARLPAVDGSLLTNLPIPAAAVTTKLVTDSTDIVLNDIASSYNNVGSSFSVNIPTNGTIKLGLTGRLRSDSASWSECYFGIRIGTTNYWFSQNTGLAGGSASTYQPMSIMASGTLNSYTDRKGGQIYVQATSEGGPLELGIAINSIPTGTQTIQVIAARSTNGACSLRGTTKPTRCVLEFVSAS